MANIIKIPDGNAFKLRITGNIKIEEYSEEADFSVINSLKVNFVRRSRIAQTSVVNPQGKIVVENEGNLACGIYGVELTGYYNGEPWRYFMKDVFEIIDETEEADPGTSVDNVLTYDVSMDVSFGGDGVSSAFVEAVVNMHNNDESSHPSLLWAIGRIVDDIIAMKEDIAHAGKVDDVEVDGESIVDENKVAHIDSDQFGKVNDVKVNGSSVVSEKVADITIPTKVSDLDNDSDFATKQEAQQMVDDAKIDTVSVDYQEDGGAPDASASFEDGELALSLKNMKMRFSDLTAADKAELKGEKGDQGDSAIFTGEGEPWSGLKNATGQSTTEPMTQKAVTDALDERTAFTLKSWTRTEINAKALQWYINSNNVFASTTGNYEGRKIDVDPSYRGKAIRIGRYSTVIAIFAFLKSWPTASGQTANYCDNTGRITYSSAGFYEAVIPDDCAYLYVAYKDGGVVVTPELISIISTVKEKFSALEEKDVDIKNEIDSLSASLDITELSLTGQQIGGGDYWWINSSNGSFASTTRNYAARILSLSSFKGKTLNLTAGTYQSRYAFLKSLPSAAGQTASAHYCNDTTLYTLAANSTVKKTIPDDCAYLYVDYKYAGNINVPQTIKVTVFIKQKVEESSDAKPDTVYLSASGSDDNDGKTPSSPKATFAAAMNAGSKNMQIVLLSNISGGINLSAWNGLKQSVIIRGGRNTRSRIIVGKKLTGLEAYSGYNDVYTYTPSENEVLPSSAYHWLWQHDIEDASTVISSSERHPLQKGRTYRRLSTRMVNKTTLADLLSATTPCWTVDNSVLYLRVVAGSDPTTNPVYVPSDGASAIITGEYNVTLSNVETWYGNIYAGQYSGNGSYLFKAIDCAARYCIGAGAWRLDDTISTYLERCEADSCTMLGTTGDGFNLHPAFATTNIYAKGSTHTLIDCWSHDNKDDGYSDHGRSEGTIIGGLFEYNGKGGVLPSYGSHDTLYGVTARRNWAGIYCAGGANDGGMGTQVECNGCVCLENTYNYSCLGVDSGDEQVNLVLNGCISRNAFTAAVYANKNCVVVLRDCTDSGSPTVKSTSSGATITIDNGIIIS